MDEKQERKKTKEVVRYAENPFLDETIVPKKDKRIQLSRLGKDENVLINQATGEMQGTHLTTWKTVDTEEFAKLFIANVALTFDLSKAGIKAFNVLVFAIKNAISKDLILLDKFVLSDFIEAHEDWDPPKKMAGSTFLKGLAELEKEKIIAKNIRQGWYYINPSFVFNGDRIAFTTVIEKRKKTFQEEAEAHGQQRLPIDSE